MASFDPASLSCAAAKPNRLLRTSAGSDWSCLLLDLHEGRGQGEVFETHPTSDTTLVVALEGEHRVEVVRNGHWRSATYQPGAAGLTPGLETTRLRWSSPSDRPFRTAHIYIPQALVESTAEELGRIGRPVGAALNALIFSDPVVATAARALVRAAEAGLPDLYADQASRWLTTHILSRQTGAVSGESRRPDPLTDRRLTRVTDYVSAHLQSPLSLADLAREAAMSVHHFARRFRERLGATPLVYVTAARMEAAALLLETTDLPVAEIGRRCGYVSAPAFSAAFQRAWGLSPRVYRSGRTGGDATGRADL